MSGKTAVLTLCSVMMALTVSALFLTTILHATGLVAAVVWLPAFAVMVGMIMVAARSAKHSNSC